MRHRVLVALLALASLLLTLSPRVTADARGPSYLQAAASTPAGSAKIWEGRNAEFEEYLRTAEIDRIEDVPIGVTHPKRAFFKPGGPVASAAWKVLRPGRPAGYWESYKSEIAAYELDKLLGMGMVPVAVEKRWKGDTAAAILWLSPIHSWKEMEARPKPGKWVRQVARMKMFDNFICNKDRNAGNLMVDDDWNLFLIDHSRAFLSDKDLAVKMEHIDPQLWNRILALDEPALTGAIGQWVDGGGAIRSMLARREKMQTAIGKLVAANGEAAVFLK
jgi:Phosphatidylinositol 3- and 4-kinase